MLANFFGKSKPINAVIISLLFFTGYGLLIFNGKTDFNWVIIPWFLFLFGLVNFINSKNNLTFDNSYFFLFFILLLGTLYGSIKIDTNFYATVCSLQFLRKCYSLQNHKNIFKKIFDAGFWIGIAYIFEPVSVFLSIIVFIAMISYSKLTIRTILIFILGYIVPFILFFTYCFWFDKTQGFINLFYWGNYFETHPFTLTENSVSVIGVGIFVFISILLKTPKALAVINDFRVSWTLTLVLLAITILIYVLTGSILWVIFPLSIILANGLELFQHKKIGDITLIIFIINFLISSFL